jgi:uncharacterized protein (TIGR02117 family)
MGILQILFLIYCLPLFFAYAILCFTVPLIRIGDIKKGKGLRLYVVKDAIHADYLFESSLWRNEFAPKGKYIKIGWGDRKIFLETKDWSSLKIIDFLFAFFGLNKTVLRVDFLDEIPQGSTEINIDELQLEVLKIYVKDSHNERIVQKRPHYYQKGDFYESDLKYNCITNCNNWVNRGLYLSRATNRIWCPISFWL